MRKLLFYSVLLLCLTSNAGTGFSFGGSSSSSSIDRVGGTNFGNGKIGGLVSLEGLLKKNSRAQILAVEQDRIDGVVIFQTATPIETLNDTSDSMTLLAARNKAKQEPTQWDIKTWQGSEAKIQALPELQNALEYSRTIKNWQQLK